MDNELQEITIPKLESYLKITGVANNLTPQETQNFLQIAMDFKLNPFKREIYCTSYGQGQYKQTSIIIGYEVYIKRAERTGQLDGWNVTTSGSVASNDLKAQITIYRKDRKHPFIHEVDYSEYVQYVHDKNTNTKRPNKIWAEKPITMLKKVVTAQGFRLAFSDELGGIPYDNSELPGSMEREIQAATQHKLVEQEEKKTLAQSMTNTDTENEYLPDDLKNDLDAAMLEARQDEISYAEMDEAPPKSEPKTLVEIVGTVADQEDVKLFFASKRNKTHDFLDKYPDLELMMQNEGVNKGKYLFQPLGTWKSSQKK